MSQLTRNKMYERFGPDIAWRFGNTIPERLEQSLLFYLRLHELVADRVRDLLSDQWDESEQLCIAGPFIYSPNRNVPCHSDVWTRSDREASLRIWLLNEATISVEAKFNLPSRAPSRRYGPWPSPWTYVPVDESMARFNGTGQDLQAWECSRHILTCWFTSLKWNHRLKRYE
jgi:hypothetical protein